MGRVWKFGHNIDTDIITPTQYLMNYDESEFVPHTLEPIKPDFADESEPGDIIVAGRNFGCGSSRESAAIAIKENGIEAIVAVSFARIFYRNAINIGLPVYICPGAYSGTEDGDSMHIEHTEGRVINETREREFSVNPHPEFVADILEAGGIGDYRQHL